MRIAAGLQSADVTDHERTQLFCLSIPNASLDEQRSPPEQFAVSKRSLKLLF